MLNKKPNKFKKEKEFLELIYTRRSIRFYKEKNVPVKTLNRIIEAGLRAPSSKNSQPWYFLVLRGEKKNRICDWVLENPSGVSFKVPNLRKGQKTKSPLDSVKISLQIVRQASDLIIIFNRGPFTGGEEKLGKNPTRDDMYNSELVGIGACMQNILLAAHGLGLGAVALMDLWPAAKTIQKRFKIKYDFVVGIAVGYPNIKLKKRDIQPKKFAKFI